MNDFQIRPTYVKDDSRHRRTNLLKNYKAYKYLYIMLIPGIIYYFIFRYVPIYGVIIAFKDFKILKGLAASPWVGLKYFKMLMNSSDVWRVFGNTLIISGLKLLINFPAVIIFALLLNEVRHSLYKKIVQTVSYLPHFLSWVILGGIVTNFLSPSTGPINMIIKAFGIDPIYFVADVKWFRPTLVVSALWKEVGWGSIIYLAALSNVDIQLYDAAKIDGAGRLRQTWHISLPAILPVVVIMFIFAVGSVINDDFDQIFNLYKPVVYSVGDVFSTYVYRMGLEQAQYSFATAAGLLKNVIAFVLIITTNSIAKKFTEYSVW